MKSLEQLRLERLENMLTWRLEIENPTPHRTAEAEALDWAINIVIKHFSNCTEDRPSIEVLGADFLCG